MAQCSRVLRVLQSAASCVQSSVILTEQIMESDGTEWNVFFRIFFVSTSELGGKKWTVASETAPAICPLFHGICQLLGNGGWRHSK